NYLTDRSCRLVDWNDMQSVLISSLQSIMKTVNILCSDCCWVLCTPTTGSFTQKKRERKFLVELQKALEACHIPFKNEYVEDKEIKEPRVSCMIPDGLGKYWSGPFVSVRSFGNKEDSQTVVCCSLFGSFERMTASILERFRGNLPLSIAPEQVRLVSMPSQSVHTKMAFERLSHEGFRVGVDRADRRLAEKVHSAEKEKVPYIAVIGEVEAKKNMLTLRKNERNNKQRNVTINDLLDELHQENSEMSPFAF
ncbi:MAG: His/Gly/Thr/Pro-type tRNA ligase C-terminal domain-containing protein, partial [Chlamydiota bacterium]